MCKASHRIIALFPGKLKRSECNKKISALVRRYKLFTQILWRCVGVFDAVRLDGKSNGFSRVETPLQSLKRDVSLSARRIFAASFEL